MLTRLKECEHHKRGEYCFTLAFDDDPMLERTMPNAICDRCGTCLPNAKCEDCSRRATIHIHRGQSGDLFLCDTCAFHLARIILQDIGHTKIMQLDT